MRKFILSVLLIFPAVLLWSGDINSAKDLEAFIKAYNACSDVSAWMSADSTFCIGADLDLSKVKKLPQLNAFAGVLDGRGHKIKGWKTQGGLIREILPEASVRGIVIDASCVMKVASKTELFAAGFIADVNKGIVSDCDNYGSISHKCSYTPNHVFLGGIVGINKFCVMRCRNFGKIMTESFGADANAAKEITCASGGITGGANGKVLPGATIVGCENHGDVVQICDFYSGAVGGIAGFAGNVSIKFCINKGSVRSEMSPNSNNAVKGNAKVGGIAGLTKGDVMCCDNLGTVTSSGIGSVNIGGIVGMPHAALVVGDCVNGGKVVSSNEGVCNTGGIAGVSGRPVHFRRCFNRGEVRFEGVSSRERSSTGGILGMSYVTKSYNVGTYIRECANYGFVHSESGGNNYANADAAIHTGGIAGCMLTRPGVPASLQGCTNSGKVTSASGRRSNMCAAVENVRTGGKMNEENALSVEAASGSPNVYGRVTDTEGNPVEGVVVSDGRQCVKTASDGTYSMHSDLKDVQFIYISQPASYKVASVGSIPQCFRRVSRDDKAVCANFVLEKRTAVPRDYTVLMVGDPQVRPLKYGDNSMEVWGDTVAPDIEAYRASCQEEVFVINLGDLVYNYMYAYDDYLDNAAQINCPVYNVIGNHDYDQQTLFDGHLGQVFFETYIGPENYSFDMGDIHYVVVNSIQYGRKKATDRYGSGLDDKTMEWLRNDLQYVPKEKTLVVCGHANLFKKPGTSPNGSHGAYNMNYENYRELLKQYSKVYSWSGHYHQNYYYNYSGKESVHGAENIECISVARCTGALRFNKYISTDGTPQGYMVMNVSGDKVEWTYKSVGQPLDYQMRLYAPGRCGDAYVRSVIWNWSEGWTMPEWWENGEKVGEMKLIRGIDPDYKDLWDKFTSKRDRKYCKPQDDALIFAITPSEGARSGEVRVKDRYGKEYISNISW